MKECPVILGMPTLYRVMEVIKESEISTLATLWGASRISWLMRNMQARIGQVMHDDVANKPISINSVDEVVKVTKRFSGASFWPQGHTQVY